MKTKNIKGLLFVAVLSFILISCEKTGTVDSPGDPVDILTTTIQKEVIDSVNSFAFDLFKPILNSAGETENIMISPFSITSALSMTLNGAAGETFEAMNEALRLKGKTLEEINSTYLKLMTEMVPVDKRVVVEIANSVWVEKRFTAKEPFITSLETSYRAEVKGIDALAPGAVDIVNGWIADKTHNKITKMLNQLDPDMAMLLINAIYFNGKWRSQFNEADTYADQFYVSPSVSKSVPMMHQTQNLNVAYTDNLTLVEIPYGQGNYTMTVVLPDENVNTNDLAASITPQVWHEWIGSLANATREVKLTMPRFKYSFKIGLNNILGDLGMAIVFTDQADFSNISDLSLLISRVLHQTFIETDEEGTEAAAATAVEIGVTSIPVITEVNLNRPFLYFIRETSTGTILFMGRVGDPTQN